VTLSSSARHDGWDDSYGAGYEFDVLQRCREASLQSEHARGAAMIFNGLTGKKTGSGKSAAARHPSHLRRRN
jgi:hypothetical protein